MEIKIIAYLLLLSSDLVTRTCGLSSSTVDPPQLCKQFQAQKVVEECFSDLNACKTGVSMSLSDIIPQSSCDRLVAGNLPSSQTTMLQPIRNCDNVYNNGSRSNGIYTVFTGRHFVDIYCELESEKKWMVFQRRLNGEVDFFLNWDSYVCGFGNKSAEFWLGLQVLHEITTSASYRLRIDLEDWDENQTYAEYSTFSIANRSSNYTLQVEGFSGNATDSFASYHNGQQFSTKDRDNDADCNKHCALNFTGAWWYRDCLWSNLNGQYRDSGKGSKNGLEWSGLIPDYSMKKASMKIAVNENGT